MLCIYYQKCIGFKDLLFVIKEEAHVLIDASHNVSAFLSVIKDMSQTYAKKLNMFMDVVVYCDFMLTCFH